MLHEVIEAQRGNVIECPRLGQGALASCGDDVNGSSPLVRAAECAQQTRTR